jgi:hypothetical protein
MAVASAAGFYAPVPEAPREDLLRDYLRFLETRNGTIDSTVPYPKREAWLEDAQRWPARHRNVIAGEAFARNYVRFDPATAPSPQMLALLSFVKANAGEAYGVEVLRRMRHAAPLPENDVFASVERVLAQEETYHTRILVGAARQFDLPEPRGAWKPPLPLKVLIGALAYSPKALFHPILLGAEIGGVFTFNWMLQKAGEVFRDEPEVAETMERRLIEILIDEIGHIAFNRLAVGPTGLTVAKNLAGQIAHANSGISPEFRGLGWSASTRQRLDRFDLADLPEEVRRRAFFV